jgi:hypothetical protein
VEHGKATKVARSIYIYRTIYGGTVPVVPLYAPRYVQWGQWLAVALSGATGDQALDVAVAYIVPRASPTAGQGPARAAQEHAVLYSPRFSQWVGGPLGGVGRAAGGYRDAFYCTAGARWYACGGAGHVPACTSPQARPRAGHGAGVPCWLMARAREAGALLPLVVLCIRAPQLLTYNHDISH